MAELAGFQKRGSQVWLRAPAHSQIYQRATAAGIPVLPMSGGKLRFPFTLLQVAAWLRRVRAQIVNTHSSRDAWLVGLAARLARVPLLVRTRHIDVDYPNRWLSRHAYTTLADHVLTTSTRITADFQEMFHLTDDRISTVPTGIDLEWFSPAGPIAELLPTPDPQKIPLIGMVSVLRSWKGHETFLEAVRLLSAQKLAARFVIVGEGPLRQIVERSLREKGLSDAVTLTGHREDVPAVLRALAVLAIPSTQHEGVPQIGLQALATKTPVVGSDAGGIPEIIRPGETGRIFPARDAAALAAALRETLERTEATRALCERGRALVESHHSLAAMLDTLDALYRRHLPE